MVLKGVLFRETWIKFLQSLFSNISLKVLETLTRTHPFHTMKTFTLHPIIHFSTVLGHTVISFSSKISILQEASSSCVKEHFFSFAEPLVFPLVTNKSFTFLNV